MRTLWIMLATGTMLGASSITWAQSYPTKPITLVVPFSPGAAMDAGARMLAESMGDLLGQSVIVENRAGASGNIGYSYVARAPNDGYTILVGYSATTACNPTLFPDVQWKVDDFQPIGSIARNVLILTTHPSVPVKDLNDLIDYSKENPEELYYGSPGIGSLVHIATEQLQNETGMLMTHVPYKGAGDVVLDLLSGQIQFSLLGALPIKQHVDAGKLVAIAVAGDTKDPTLPDVPTTEELGVAGLKAEGWLGLFAPTGTPQEVIDTIAMALKTVSDDPVYRSRVEASGLAVQYSDSEVAAGRVRADTEECSSAIADAGIVPE